MLIVALKALQISREKKLTLPVHPGDLKYYKEAGLAKYIPKDLLPNNQ